MKVLLQMILLSFSFSAIAFAQTSNEQILRLKYRLDTGSLTERVRAASFRPDGKKVLLVGENSTQVWSTVTGKRLFTFPEKMSLENGFFLTWQPNGTKVVQYSHFIGQKTPAYLWDTENGKLIAVFNEKPGLKQAQWNKDGARLLTVGELWPGGKTASFSIRDENGKAIRTDDLYPYSPWLIQFSHDGRRIITSDKGFSGRKPIQLTDAETGDLIKSFDQERRPSAIDNYAIFSAESPDGKFICGQIYLSKGVVCWKTSGSESPLYYFPDDKQTGDISFLSFSPDSKLFAISKAKKKTIEIIETETGKVKTVLDNPNKTRLWKNDYSIPWLPEAGDSWSPSGRFFLATNFEKEANLWDARTGRLIARLPLIYKEEHEFLVGTFVTDFEAFSFHPSEQILLSVSQKAVRLWQPETGKLLQEIRAADQDKSRGSVQKFVARWSPDGKLLMTADDENRIILLWDVLDAK